MADKNLEDLYKSIYEKKADKDYDGDGKVESGSKEHAGAVHNAIQRKKGLKPDGQDTRKEEVEEYVDFLIDEGYDCSELTWEDMFEEYESLDEGLRSAVKRLLGKKEAPAEKKPESRGEQLRKKYNVGPEKSDTSAKRQILDRTRAKKERDQKEYGGSHYSKSVAKKSADAHDRYLRAGYSKYGADDRRGSGNKARKRAEALKKEDLEMTGLFLDWEIDTILEVFNEGVRDTDPEKGTAERKERLEKKRGMKLDDHPQYKKEEAEYVDENRRAARAAGGSKDDSKKQPDPSKAGFTGMGNMSIDQIRKMSARIEKEKTKKEEVEHVEEGIIDAAKAGSKRHEDAMKGAGRAIKKARIRTRKLGKALAPAADTAKSAASGVGRAVKATYDAGKKTGEVVKKGAQRHNDMMTAAKKVFSKEELELIAQIMIDEGYDLSDYTWEEFAEMCEAQQLEEDMKQARDNVGASTCWDGYEAKGTKNKGGKEVPNCVKKEETSWATRSKVEFSKPEVVEEEGISEEQIQEIAPAIAAAGVALKGAAMRVAASQTARMAAKQVGKAAVKGAANKMSKKLNPEEEA